MRKKKFKPMIVQAKVICPNCGHISADTRKEAWCGSCRVFKMVDIKAIDIKAVKND